MYAYTNCWLDVNLTNRTVTRESFSEDVMRTFLGGTGISAKILYDRVQPGVEWYDPENCIIICGGVLNGTKMAGSGAHSQMTKGPLSEGASCSQAMGNLGAYLSFSGVDGLIVHGKADGWVYLYVHDGTVEIRDGQELSGLSTYDTEIKVKEWIDRPDDKSSVFAIGPAGENMVRIAAVSGDHGHVAAHGGIGAVWGSKKLKALAAEKGNHEVDLYDKEALKQQQKQMIIDTYNDPDYDPHMNRGTSHLFNGYISRGLIPYKNLTSNVLPEEYYNLRGEYYREKFEAKRHPCYACPSNHCRIITVTEGPYTGFTGDEPEYELIAGMGSMIGNPDPGAAIMLANQWDLIGADGNEGSWLIAFAIECFERGLLTLEDTGGLELRWGNVEAVKEMIWKVARREGIGDVLAEGVKRAAEKIGGEAVNIGVYLMKGYAVRGHDHRASRWSEIVDNATSNCGTIESINVRIPPEEAFSPEGICNLLYKGKLRLFVDSLVVCMFPTRTMTKRNVDHLIEMINSATGWDYDNEKAFSQALRCTNLLRAFNLRHGIGPELEYPSRRYSDAPVDGLHQGKTVMSIWEETLDKYYEIMEWDRKTGRPHKETLTKLGLEYVIKDLY